MRMNDEPGSPAGAAFAPVGVGRGICFCLFGCPTRRSCVWVLVLCLPLSCMRVPHPSRFVRRVGSPPILRKPTPVGLRQDARMTSGVPNSHLSSASSARALQGSRGCWGADEESAFKVPAPAPTSQARFARWLWAWVPPFALRSPAPRSCCRPLAEWYFCAPGRSSRGKGGLPRSSAPGHR